MQLSTQHLYPVIALAALAAGSIWLERVTEDPAAGRAAPPARGPDVIIEGMSLVRYAIDGRPQYYIDATRMTHLPDQAHSLLDAPVMRFLRENQTLDLRADNGIARDDGERVDLAGQVVADRRIPGKPDAHFTSESLVLWPNTEQAKSIDPVLLTQNGTEVRGNGMTADNLFGQIQLTGGVTAHMPTQRTQP